SFSTTLINASILNAWMFIGGFGLGGNCVSCACGSHFTWAFSHVRCCSSVLPGGTHISLRSSSCINCSLRLIFMGRFSFYCALETGRKKAAAHFRNSGLRPEILFGSFLIPA